MGPRHRLGAASAELGEQEAGREHPDEPRDDDDDERDAAGEGDAAEADGGPGRRLEDPVELETDEEEDGVLQHVGDGAPRDPLGDAGLRRLDDRRLVPEEEASDDDQTPEAWISSAAT